MTRDQIFSAIRGGATTSAEISVIVNQPYKLVCLMLYKMKKSGVVVSTEHPTLVNIAGNKKLVWHIVEGFEPRIKYSEAALKAYSERCIARRNNPELEGQRKSAWYASMHARSIEIPNWVLPSHRRTYREIARVLDEETAAEWARKAKRIAGGHVRPIEGKTNEPDAINSSA